MKIFLGSVAWRQIEQGHHSSVVQLFMECARRGIEIREGSVVGDALVSRARSIAASAFLRSDCDVMLSIDSDIWFRPQDAIELCELALAGHDIIGALYMTRAMSTQPAMMLPDAPVTFAAGQLPVETRFVSTGFTAVTRAPFEALARTLPHCHQTWRNPIDGQQDTSFWPFYMPFTVEWPQDGYIYLSEDWAFCQRAADAGFKLWVHPGIRVGHIGSYMYTLEDLLRPERARPQPLRMTRSAEGKLNTEFMKQVAPEIMSLPRHVAEYLRIESVEELKIKLNQASSNLAQLYREANDQKSDAFYRRGDVGQAYILDLAAWHIRPKVADILTEHLMPLRAEGWRVLDYGSGIGTAALILAGGNRVTCVEPNAVLREFTGYRAKELGVAVEFINGNRALRGYDLAVCWDVLEHVPNPASTARAVAAALKPGGLLFADSDFTDEGNHPMHNVSADDPHGVKFWGKLGLQRISNYWWRKPLEGSEANGTAV